MLADGKSTEEVWAELARDYELAGDQVDTEDIETAIKRPGTRSNFVVATNDAELVDLLSGDFEAWRTFLHPAQRASRSVRSTRDLPGHRGSGDWQDRRRSPSCTLLGTADDRSKKSTERILFAT